MKLDERVVWREAALVAFAALVQIGATVLISHGPEEHGTPLLGLGLLALGVAAIPFRLRFPVPALVVAFAATLAYVSLDYADGPVFVSLIVTFGAVVLAGYRWVALATMVVGFVGFSWLGPAFGRGDGPTAAVALALAAWLLLLFTGFELIRTRRDRARAAAQAKADTLQRQIANERLVIARELHDVVAHNMSLINLQAGVALHLHDELPGPAREALETIKSASKEALVELRSILGVLRHADDGEGAPRAPTAGLAGLHDLVGRARAAGVDVSFDLDGVDLRGLPRAVDIAAFRIVQESLTNVARHAVPPVAKVRVKETEGSLLVSIVDAGTGRRRTETLPSGGNGLAGMYERAAAVGGTLAAGPRLGGGFAVDARLPLDQDRQGR